MSDYKLKSVSTYKFASNKSGKLQNLPVSRVFPYGGGEETIREASGKG